MSIVKFENVTFGYNGKPILENVNFTISEREFCCIVGSNGSGKTTLLKMILGIINPWKGNVLVFSTEPEKSRTRIGYMPQDIHYDQQFPITVIDVVLMGRLVGRLAGHYSVEDKFATHKAMADMEIEDLANNPFTELSMGQRQRVLIARALACNPDLLIFDEPTASVDVLIENKIFELLQKLNEKMAIIMVSHNINFVADIVQKVICVDNRRVAVHDTAEIDQKLINDLKLGHYRAIVHEKCKYGKCDE